MNENENETITLLPGDRFAFKGLEWIVLDSNVDGGILIITASNWGSEPLQFDENGSNNYKESTLRKRLFDKLLPILGCYNLLPHEVSLVADSGEDDYDSVKDLVFILSCDDYRKYRKYIPDEEQWICTPSYVTYSEYNAPLRYMSFDTHFRECDARTDMWAFPACVLNSNRLKITKKIEVIEREEEEWE